MRLRTRAVVENTAKAPATRQPTPSKDAAQTSKEKERLASDEPQDGVLTDTASGEVSRQNLLGGEVARKSLAGSNGAGSGVHAGSSGGKRTVTEDLDSAQLSSQAHLTKKSRDDEANAVRQPHAKAPAVEEQSGIVRFTGQDDDDDEDDEEQEGAESSDTESLDDECFDGMKVKDIAFRHAWRECEYRMSAGQVGLRFVPMNDEYRWFAITVYLHTRTLFVEGQTCDVDVLQNLMFDSNLELLEQAFENPAFFLGAEGLKHHAPAWSCISDEQGQLCSETERRWMIYGNVGTFFGTMSFASLSQSKVSWNPRQHMMAVCLGQCIRVSVDGSVAWHDLAPAIKPRVEALVKERLSFQFVALGSHDRLYIKFGGGRHYAEGPARFKAAVQDSWNVAYVTFGTDYDSWLVIKLDHSVVYNNVPQGLEHRLTQKNQIARLRFASLAPDNPRVYFVVYLNNRIAYSGLPASITTEMKDGLSLCTVVFNRMRPSARGYEFFFTRYVEDE
ncbi:hypothetical protein FVE85_2017 [Porphyridium purpureum]|uniref:Uncharacterized protein n=1 Tax=Porphyridium purpureum TaxID=35688 RepID=A0A5J4YYA1_PORPP|nr:hypothetical protein FVE85_2017 [Porphyridium purpureum]|eukprot:POR1826..scf209_3